MEHTSVKHCSVRFRYAGTGKNFRSVSSCGVDKSYKISVSEFNNNKFILSRKINLPMVIQIYNPRESMIRRHAMWIVWHVSALPFGMPIAHISITHV